jgi:hypothetical protein
MDGRRRRSGRPDVSYGNSDGIAHNRSVILGTIHGYYKEALAVLPLDDLPELAPRLVGAGVCFGFGDPTTNIIANTLSSFLPDKPDPDHRAKKHKRKASIKTPSAAARSDAAGDAPSPPPETRTIAERSLEGLITFLTSYFRYLPTWDALRYLWLANADLLVTVRLIELDRCYNTKDEWFHISSYAARAALTCAASSARQPDVDGFIAGSFSLVSHLEFVTQTVLADRSYVLSVEKILLLSGMLKKKPRMLDKSDNPMIFADERRLRNCHTDANASGDANCEKVPCGLTISLRAVLLDKIHAKYLKAISQLPMQDVRARYHRALVNGGYCYGPFSCVTNIIVNTLWYDSTFPAMEKLEVDMICTSTFVRVESRSLRGLIKLLLTCIPEISEHDAMIYLLKNNLKVRKAIELAGAEGWKSSWDVSAYKAAADASFHPEPEAYVQFSTQSLPKVQAAVKSLLRASTPLSSNDVLQLATLLPSSNCISAKSLETIVDLSTDALDMFIAFKEKCVTQQGFFRRKIEAALRKKVFKINNVLSDQLK